VLRDKNESGTGGPFSYQHYNHQPLLLSSVLSLPPIQPLLLSSFRPPLQLQQQVRTRFVSDPRKRSTFYHFDFNGTFPITTTPVRFTRPEVHTLPTFLERRSSWPQRDGRSTTLPRSSTTTRPPLSHIHTLLSLCLSLSLFLYLPLDCPLAPLLTLTISSVSTTAVSVRPPFACSLILVALTTSVFLTNNFGPLLHVVISLATISLSPDCLRYTDVVSSIEQSLALTLTLIT